ncbi:MAG: cell division protein FtsH, partial [Actinomycetota bacterium]
ENRSILDSLVEELMDKETLHKEEIEVVFKRVAARPKRPAWTGSELRIPSRVPPVEIKKKVEVSEAKPKQRKKAASSKKPSNEQ